jgi:2-keto-4-pentenoate hydratase/2-oxohepta-3-ene-1,7-dioic acid hydratase in catechol pathway
MVMFENGVGQAVHFAYEITEYASTPESQLAKIMRMAIKKNGELVQSGDTKDMIFSFNDIISHISGYFSLNIGDAIFTGTPSGVGECVVGDVLEGFVEDKKMFELLIK